MKKIVVYTAIIGDYDDLKEPNIISKDYDYVCFTDMPLQSKTFDIKKVERPSILTHVYSFQKFPVINKIINFLIQPKNVATRCARKYKVLSHKYFPNHEYSLWVDGNFLINVDIDFLIKEYLSDADIALFEHPHRNCIYKEAAVCINRKKDKSKVIKRQIEQYKKDGYPENNGLIASPIILRRHTPEIINFNEAWWEEIEKYSKRDQLSFNYVAYKNNLKYSIIEGNYFNNQYFIHSGHKKKKQKHLSTLEVKNIYDLIKGCNLNMLKEELLQRGVKFTVLKEKKKRLYLAVEYGGKHYHVKVHNFVKEPKLNKMIGNIFSDSQAKRSWEKGCLFIDLSLPTPRPLGYLEKRRFGLLLSSILITEHLPDVVTLRNMYTLLPDSVDRRFLIIELAKFVAMLHNKGVIHGDLKASNILVKRHNRENISFYITDLASAEFNKGLTIDEMASDIACLDTSFGSEIPPRERLRFLSHYCKIIEGRDVNIRDLIKVVQSHSVKRMKKRKRVFK